MKKALIITTVSGFLGQFEMNNVKLLQRYGYEVHYAADFSFPVYETDFRIYREQGICMHDFPIRKSPLRAVCHFRALIKLIRLIRREKIQLIHCHTPVGGALGRMAGMLSRRSPTVIYTAHGFHFYKGAPFWQSLFSRAAEQILAGMTDVLITINREDYENAKRFRMKTGGRTYRIPGIGVDTSRFFPSADKAERKSIRKKYKIPEQAFLILTCASLDPDKNHRTGMESLALLKDPEIFWLVCGEGKCRKHLEKQAERLGISDRVIFAGYEKQIDQVLKAADLFLFPSVREGLGMAALEALACGIPVVAADNRGTREYMKNGVNGIVCPGTDAAAFAAAVKKLKADCRMRGRISAEGVRTAENFAVFRTEKVMRSVYRQAEERTG